MSYRVAENSSTEERTGTLTIAGLSFAVRQRGADPPRPENVDVEGRVGGLSGSCPNLTMGVGGQTVNTDPSTNFKHGNCSDVRPGVEVKVKGQRIGSGPVIAREVDIKRD